MFIFEHDIAHGLCRPHSAKRMTGKLDNKEDIDFRVMRLLQAKPETSQRELAQALGISLGGINYCLKALMTQGWIKIQNFNHSSNKLGYAYVLTPRGISRKAELAGRFLKRKMEEYEALRTEIESLRSETEPRSANSQNC
jgi:EPS-associated MarR family transcriptional regulator